MSGVILLSLVIRSTFSYISLKKGYLFGVHLRSRRSRGGRDGRRSLPGAQPKMFTILIVKHMHAIAASPFEVHCFNSTMLLFVAGYYWAGFTTLHEEHQGTMAWQRQQALAAAAETKAA